MTLDLPSDLVTLLAEMRATLNEINAKIDGQSREAMPPAPPPEHR